MQVVPAILMKIKDHYLIFKIVIQIFLEKIVNCHQKFIMIKIVIKICKIKHMMIIITK